MFCFLLSTALGVGPIFNIPGMMGSSLYATIEKPETIPKCSDFPANKATQIWPETDNSISSECLYTILDTIVEDGVISPPKGIIVDGGEIFNVTKGTVKLLAKYDNVFTVPYDWAHYYANTNNTFENLKNKIEYEVNSTMKNEKVERAILVSHSLGSSFVRYFLSRYVTSQWKNNYLERAVFIAPAYAGSFMSVGSLLTGLASSFSGDFVRHAPSLISLIPNIKAKSANSYINNQAFLPHELIEYLAKSQPIQIKGVTMKVDQTTKQIYDLMKSYLEEDLSDPGIPSLVVFNKGMKTPCGFNLTVKDGQYELNIINCEGDGVIPFAGIQYGLSKMRTYNIFYYNTDNSSFSHQGLTTAPDVIAEVEKYIDQSKPVPFGYDPVAEDKKKKKIISIVISVILSVIVMAIVITVIVCVVKKKKREDFSLLEN